MIKRDQVPGADLLLSSPVAAAVQARPVPAAPRIVYDADRIPPWRCAPPLAHV